MDVLPELPGKSTSVWTDTVPATDWPTLEGEVAVEVAVIGGGIAGISTAWQLKMAGRTVALVEAGRLLQGVTGQTTAKFTSQHTLLYSHLLRHFGEAKALAYAEANQAALEQVAQLVAAGAIDCDFERTEAWTWADTDAEAALLRDEAEAARRLGLPARYQDDAPLPFPVRGALCFDRQAQLHPLKFLQHLARQLPGGGSHVFEGSPVLAVSDGEPCQVSLVRGHLRAGAVILATHYPLGDHSLYALRLHPQRAYALAARLDGPAPPGMFINVSRNHSLRPCAWGGAPGLLLVGEGHPVGEGGDTRDHYRHLETWARSVLPVTAIDYHWSTHDHHSIDRVPYIGRLSPLARHVYTATGFGGWGMSNGIVAGLLLRDLVMGRDNSWAEVYDPARLKLAGARNFMRHTLSVGRHWVGDRLRRSEPELAPGEGGMLTTSQGRLAVYRDEAGVSHALSPHCTHMGCVLQWNAAETSWDCPCHGSRFDAVTGAVLHGPALAPLARHILDVAGQRKAG